ncbi:MAG: hypothetical protein QOJ19_4621, partial [Acidimicrobiia bacterium]|nr:hypothetical protein [Acidimicrobiia bacterium]
MDFAGGLMRFELSMKRLVPASAQVPLSCCCEASLGLSVAASSPLAAFGASAWSGERLCPGRHPELTVVAARRSSLIQVGRIDTAAWCGDSSAGTRAPTRPYTNWILVDRFRETLTACYPAVVPRQTDSGPLPAITATPTGRPLLRPGSAGFRGERPGLGRLAGRPRCCATTTGRSGGRRFAPLSSTNERLRRCNDV